MVRAEDEFDDLLPPLQHGRAEVADEDEKSADDIYLYVPDLSGQTGWSAWRVRRNREREGRPLGFRR